MLNFSMPELAMVLVIALIVFGPGKLPEVGKALGKGLREFRREMDTSSQEPVNIEGKSVEKEPGDHVEHSGGKHA
ncbi:sec-independent protein translocase protein TatA [Sporomusaceae bacterium BoRhaA]|uniref:Sec-independent protein translocase subunit TatA/TatB n=1 Tax=Pelorhabdus rhamnosifermentans TaxID=2772457 RepID=UPI001C0637A6|nr:twin-arginine translocase TatA/TatE family subunit [Pelorhabdus rhamnosifermentans]MBU2702369.1 sec-independent protein translocase protein TatA [Pelorhabdus rhamnosifermentans]